MKPGYLELTCRRCGAGIKLEVKDVPFALALNTDLKRTHECNDRHLGICELVGGTLDEETATDGK